MFVARGVKIQRASARVHGLAEMLGGLQRRPGQVVVQTWHGIPVRQVGLDDENGTLRDGLGWARRARAEAARWDLVPAATPQHGGHVHHP